ncbi:MAG: DUF1080 domain-containing protein [Bacteroidales bacterium]|jgi:hypothetical protein|nr:DUF1080 domain-containing protein [Bacteroidales bacterium]
MKKISLVAAMLLVLATSCSQKPEVIKLFNGRDLEGWTLFANDPEVAPTDVFSVVDGNIRVAGQPFGFMRTNEKYTDVKLSVEWRWVGQGSNSGIFSLVQDGLLCWPNAIECQLKAGSAGDVVLLGGSDVKELEAADGARPRFPMVRKENESSEKPDGEWNLTEIVITSDGGVDITINGVHQNHVTNKNFTEGYIALQSEGGPLEFRNVTVTRLAK